MFESDTDIATADGTMNTYIVSPDQEGRYPVVLFFMDAPGVRGELRAMAKRLACEGYVVLLPNLYYRTTRKFRAKPGPEGLKEIYAIIFELRRGKPTIIRAFDAYNPRIVQDCTEDGVFEECKLCWETYNQAIHQAADEMGIPVAPVFDHWNGPDHTDDPNDKGYTQAVGIHPDAAGAAATARLLRELGYEPITP